MYGGAYSQLTNELFYSKDENKDSKTTEKGSIINTIKDDKLIIVLHELYINTTLRRECIITLDYLIRKCGYQVNQKSRKSFQGILNQLKTINLINFDKNTTKDKILEINTEELFLKSSNNYLQISDEEIIQLTNVNDLRLRMTLLRLYTYFKATTYKRGIDAKTGKRYNIQIDSKPQITWQSYEYIERFTNIGQSHLKGYINKLKELGMIDYISCGKKYKLNDKNKKLSECPNIYTICSINDCGNKQELEFGLSQCKYYFEEKGWVIIKTEYKNNNRQINGKKGGLIKKLNNGTITEEQIKELEYLTKEKE